MPRTIVLTLLNDDEVVDCRSLEEADPKTIGEETVEAAIAILRDVGGLVPGDMLTITEETNASGTSSDAQ
jgi:hypothetical protein